MSFDAEACISAVQIDKGQCLDSSLQLKALLFFIFHLIPFPPLQLSLWQVQMFDTINFICVIYAYERVDVYY